MLPYERAERVERRAHLPTVLIGPQIQVIIIGKDRVKMILHGQHPLSFLLVFQSRGVRTCQNNVGKGNFFDLMIIKSIAKMDGEINRVGICVN